MTEAVQIESPSPHRRQRKLLECSLFRRDEHTKPIILTNRASIYAFGLLIRKTEELLLQLFSQGLLSGTTHTCLGQELCQMAVVRALNDPHDVVLSNHRNHGHFLTYSGDFLGLLGEIMGREDSVCGGVGGSQHIAYRHFHSNGVQGGMTAIGVGEALAIRIRGQSGIVATIIGDGTLGQGLVYESFNLAAVWNVPVLFVVENNGIAQTTPTSATLAGSIEARGSAFGLSTWRLDDSSPQFFEAVQTIVDDMRVSRKPGLLVIDTRRLGPHSKGDDLRPPEEMELIRCRDPLLRLGESLPVTERQQIEAEVGCFIHDVHVRALDSSEASSEALSLSIFGPSQAPVPSNRVAHGQNVRGAINQALRDLLTECPEVILLGEDMHDPYGGAFKVTVGLSTAFPDRVMSTPISEAGIVGAAVGLSLAGFRPVVEIMFADFVTLAMDQIYNHAVKFPGMFPGTRVPLVIRTPSGGRRGYGPTHSQSPENLLCAVPGLTVVFGSSRHDVGELLKRAVRDWNFPTVFLEHKLLYGQVMDGSGYSALDADRDDPAAHLFPTLVKGSAEPDVTLVCYGGALELAESAAAKLQKDEIEVEIVVASLIAPLPRRTLTCLLRKRMNVIVVEESSSEHSFGAELGAALLESGYEGRFVRVGAPPVPIPAARTLEAALLPSDQILYNRTVDLLVEQILAGSLP